MSSDGSSVDPCEEAARKILLARERIASTKSHEGLVYAVREYEALREAAAEAKFFIVGCPDLDEEADLEAGFHRDLYGRHMA